MSCPFRSSPVKNQKDKNYFWSRLKTRLLSFFPEDEHLLKSSNLQTILENTVDAIVTIDENCHILVFNKAAEQMFGHLKQEVMGKSVNILMPFSYRSHHDEYVHNYLTTGIKHIIGIGREVSGLKKDGTLFPIHLSVSEVSVGLRRYFTGIIQDLTLQKEADKCREENIQATAELKGRTELLATVSHEFRTPLQSIMGFAECLLQELDGPLSPSQKTSLQKIYNSGEHLIGLVDNLLQLSKARLEKPPVDLISCHTEIILSECIEMVLPLAHKKGLQLHKNILDKATLSANPQHLREIFLNLLSNAIKFTEKGSITATLKSRPKEILVSIADTGCGMKQEDIQKIYTPFCSIPNQRSKEHTGLGLSITEHLVKIYKGSIEVQSEEGIGSTFTVRLPQANVR